MSLILETENFRMEIAKDFTLSVSGELVEWKLNKAIEFLQSNTEALKIYKKGYVIGRDLYDVSSDDDGKIGFDGDE